MFTPQGENEQPIEKERLTCILSGKKAGEASSLYVSDDKVDIFDAKGVSELLLETLRLYGIDSNDLIRFRSPQEDEREVFSDPSQCLVLDSDAGTLGQLARLQPETAKEFGIKQDVFFIDIDFEMLSSLQAAAKDFHSLPVFPAVKRDIALLVPAAVKAGDMLETLRSSKEKFIEQCEIFDVYQGKPLDAGIKSVAISVTYRSPTKTLTEKNVNKSHTKLINLLTSKFNGSLREG